MNQLYKAGFLPAQERRAGVEMVFKDWQSFINELSTVL